MKNQLAEMQHIIDQLASLEEPLAEHLPVALFLSSLPDSYETLIYLRSKRDLKKIGLQIISARQTS